jgi:hypothetical protein
MDARASWRQLRRSPPPPVRRRSVAASGSHPGVGAPDLHVVAVQELLSKPAARAEVFDVSAARGIAAVRRCRLVCLGASATSHHGNVK